MFDAIKLSDAVRAKLPGVQVFEFRGTLTSSGPAPDFKPDWQRLHAHWKGKSKADVEAFAPHAAFIRFYREIGFDPKAFPPSVVNLVQRFLLKPSLDRFPTVTPLVDGANIAAVESGIPLGVFDDATVVGDVFLAFTAGGEPFRPLGNPTPVDLPPGVLVLRDAEKVLSQFCYRDGEAQKVTPATRAFRLLGCQAPGVAAEDVFRGMELALEQFRRFAVVNPAAAAAA